jgi:hypothetical protein
MRPSALPRVVAVLLVLFVAAPALAQVAYIQAAVAAEQAMAKLAEDLADMRKDTIDNKKAEEIRARLSGPDGINTKFIAAMTELREEKAKLMINKKENAAEIKRLEQAEKKGEGVRAKLKKMQSLMADDKVMIGAAKSGALQRVAAEASAAMKTTAEAINAVSGGVNAIGGDDKPGSIEFTKIEVKSGKIRFFVTDRDGAEKEVFEGSTIRIAKLPISIRASIQDAEKVRLDAQWGTGGATWDPKPDTTGPAHFYAYEGAGGRSEWTAREEYKWSATDNKDRLRSLGQRNSDGSTKKATGDVVDVVPAKSVAQAVGLELEAKSLKWERKSKLPGGTRTTDVVPKDATASARLVISVFPAGTN